MNVVQEERTEGLRRRETEQWHRCAAFEIGTEAENSSKCNDLRRYTLEASHIICQRIEINYTTIPSKFFKI